MKKLNKRDLVEVVAEKAHLSKKDAQAAIDMAFKLIEKSVLKGEEVNISNFGVFSPKTRQSREGTHPKKHSRIVIAESKTVVFRPSKSLKAKLNK
ncbi:MAG: HU family DNA-binding protein [Erysipelotrichaceae bacterium]|nr:HU family DNA-binding protein [Bacilli bacterium]NLV29069.1 HU family DNA-binding protein [Erysipelotrichaceae bacterium]HPY79768.1 HU family DNA-binding protein [Bacilli bacterium]HQA55796.1 HU family DNA-binding protein [Bacilli bacterium]